MTDFRRIAKTGALALAALLLYIPVLTALHGLGLTNESHCRSESGTLFATLHDAVGGMTLEGGTGEETGRCVLPRFGTLGGWALPGGETLDLSAATPSALDPDNLVLPEAFRWVHGGYDIANPLAGRLLPTLVPLLGLLALLSAFAVCWRQWGSDGT